MQVAGIAVAVLVFFLPGYAWLVISDLSRSLDWIGRSTLSFVISIGLLSLLTAGLSLVTQQYLLISLTVSLGGSAVLLGTYFLKNRPKLVIQSKLQALPKLLVISLFAYAFLLTASFWSAPYYPTAVTSDLVVHTRLVQAILGGDGRNILLHDTTPVGLHFAAALVAYLLQIDSLNALRIVTAPVVLGVVSLFFFSARKMFGSGSTAEVVVVVGSLVLPVDLLHFILIGFYPNLLEDCIVLSLLFLLASYVTQPSKALGLSMILLTVAGVFIHSSFFLFLAAALISAPVIFFIASRTIFHNYIRGLLYPAAGLTMFGALVWPFFSGNLGRIIASYVHLGPPRIPAAPYVSYMTFVWDLGWFLGYVNIFVLLLTILFLVFLRRKSVGTVLLLLWLGILFVSPGLSDQSYRFVLFGMIPASFIIGKGLGDLRTWAASLPRRFTKFRDWIVPTVLLILILSGSLPSLIPRIINPYQRSRQEAVFSSMQWLKQQGNCSTVASSGLWPDYLYLPALTPLKYTGEIFKPSDIAQGKYAAVNCVAVATDSPYFEAFQTSPSYRYLYRNNLVWIFSIIR